MTATGMMCVGLSSPSPSPSITQVGIYLVLEDLSNILLFPLVDHLVNWKFYAKNILTTVKIQHLNLTLYQDPYIHY